MEAAAEKDLAISSQLSAISKGLEINCCGDGLADS
jgi:hypothetical protein